MPLLCELAEGPLLLREAAAGLPLRCGEAAAGWVGYRGSLSAVLLLDGPDRLPADSVGGEIAGGSIRSPFTPAGLKEETEPPELR